jgi:hypothetical protein
MSARNPSTISHIRQLIGASGSHAIKLVTVEVSAFRLSTLLRCRSLHTRKSAVGHSLRVYSAPVPVFVRCCSNRRQNVASRRTQRCAISGLMHCSKQHLYSITSSARPIKGSGISNPSALAVFRLMTSSTFVDC